LFRRQAIVGVEVIVDFLEAAQEVVAFVEF
jgi:hypothetical protein